MLLGLLYNLVLLTHVVTRCYVAADNHSYPTIVDLSVNFEEAPGYNEGEWAEGLLEAAKQNKDLRRVIVLRHGKVSFNYSRDDVDNAELFPIWSATKSWISLIFGIMVDDGNVTVNETLGDIWPSDNFTNDAMWENVNDAEFKKNVTIESMLTMSSGLITPLDPDAANATSLPPDDGTWGGANLTHALNDPQVGPVGSFSYLGSNNILSYVIQTRTGFSPREFASTRILPMLGFDDKDIAWDLNLDGIQYAYHGLNMTAEQLAKFGQLYLQEGLSGPNEDEHRVVSKDWVNRSGSPLVPTPMPLVDHYGYLFWVAGNETYCAIGFGAQLICMDGAKDAVFVQQAEYANAGLSMNFDLVPLALNVTVPVQVDLNETTDEDATEEESTDGITGEVKAASAGSSGRRDLIVPFVLHSVGLLFSMLFCAGGV